MRIAIKADELAFEMVALSELDPAAMEPAKVYGEDDKTQDFEGHPLFRLPDVFVKADGRKIPVSIKVLNKPKSTIDELTKVRLIGRAIITPYVQGGSRVALSIIADGVEALE